jgi:hypothetical protein
MYRWHVAFERLFEGGTWGCLKGLGQILLEFSFSNRTPSQQVSKQVSVRILQAASSIACKREWNGSLLGTTSNCRCQYGARCFEIQRLTRFAALEPVLVTSSLTRGLAFPGSVSGILHIKDHINLFHTWPLVHLMRLVENPVMPAARSYTVSSPLLDAEAKSSVRRDIDPWPKEIKLQKKGKVRSCGCQRHRSLQQIAFE